jgi:predicted component of type VI protein secretion system
MLEVITTLAPPHSIPSSSPEVVVSKKSSMSQPISLGDIRQTIASAYASANAAGYTLEDILPQEVQDHFQNLTQLNDARTYIKEVEEREKALEADNERLAKELREEKKKVEDLPEEHQQRITEVQMLKGNADFTTILMRREEERASDYQARWEKAQRLVIELQAREKHGAETVLENEQLKRRIIQLLEDNRSLTELYHDLTEQNENELQDKILEVEAMKCEVEHYSALNQDNQAIEHTLSGVCEGLESENSDVAAQLNATSQRVHGLERLNNATVSEVKILSRYFHRAFQVLSIYQKIFQDLISLDAKKTLYLPDDLQVTLHSAQNECDSFATMRKMMDLEGLKVDDVRSELDGMAREAYRMQGSLVDIAGDVRAFLHTLERKPDLRSVLRKKFGGFSKR